MPDVLPVALLGAAAVAAAVGGFVYLAVGLIAVGLLVVSLSVK